MNNHESAWYSACLVEVIQQMLPILLSSKTRLQNSMCIVQHTVMFLKVCMCLEKCDKNRSKEEDWRGKTVGRHRFLFYTGLFSFSKQTGICLISVSSVEWRNHPNSFCISGLLVWVKMACWPGLCPGSDCVLCHSSNGPGPGRQHSGVQDL